jgi:hypothetical protein
LSDEEIARQHDKVEVDKKEDCRRNYFQQLVQKPGAIRRAFWAEIPIGSAGRL